MDDLVSTRWLAERLGKPGLVVVDASSHLPDAGRDARAEFAVAHIPGARFLDLATLTDRHSDVPSALPSAEQFAARAAQLGIADRDRLVIYDDSAVKTSARAWFIARMHGANAAILDGGLGKWRAEGRPLESSSPAQTRSDTRAAPGAPAFICQSGEGSVRSKDQVLANIGSAREQLVDARGAARFLGAEPEPRPNMASGHIPGSANLPFGRVLKPDGTFRNAAGIRAAFADAGVDLAKPVVTTCGSGVTAAVLLFALQLVGKDDVALYDGSWSEWGADPTTPKVTGSLA